MMRMRLREKTEKRALGTNECISMAAQFNVVGGHRIRASPAQVTRYMVHLTALVAYGLMTSGQRRRMHKNVSLCLPVF